MFAVVLIMNPAFAKELILTYAIREGQPCLPGMLYSVKVRGRAEEGLVLRLRKEPGGEYRMQELGEAVYPYPMLSRQGLALARWIARFYVCPLNRAAALFLPPAVRPVQETRYYLDSPDSNDLLFIDPAWQFLWEGLKKAGAKGMSAGRMRQRWGPEAAGQADTWVEGGFLRKETGLRQIRRAPGAKAPADAMRGELSPALSPDQRRAYEDICEDLGVGRFGVHLLFGVTGSGKTEVYLRLAAHAAEAGRQSIYLVPEISLVPQLTAKARQWFGGQVAVLHSNLTPAQRVAEWQRIMDGEVKLIVGPRSALFAPVKDLGLIVIDEEHENTYKQSEPEPRYDARAAAEAMARFCKAVVVRGSATPDMESLYRAGRGEMALHPLPERIEKRPMPPILWVNMNREMKEGHPHPVSRRLLEALRDRKAKGEQAILLMNRRGFHTYVLCRDCGQSLECPRCSIPLTYHRPYRAGQGGRREADDRLICHYCGYQSGLWAACPQCGGGMLQYMGTGTQRVMDYLEKEIPELNLLRLDMDSTGKAGSHGRILKAFQDGEADVLVGTQMVAKGFDFPGVTLSAVLHIDGIINLPDYQGSERAIQLILQTAGRAGRGDIPGEVMVQTFYPDNPVLKLTGAYDYMGFYENELALRRALDYPPIKKSARILVTGENEEDVEKGIGEIAEHCRASMPAEEADNIIWLGPARAPVEKIKNRWRRHLILLSDKRAPLARCLALARAKSAAWGDEPRIILDMEPKSLL
ncbi:MAG: primosomal protein N' [Clostridiales bacterium]|nr:primosomal protein N' [Clostridiales bacterium]